MDEPRKTLPPPLPPTARAAPRRRSPLWPAMLVAVATTGLLAGAAWRVYRRSVRGASGPTPVATAERFVQGVLRGDGDCAAADGSPTTGYGAAYATLSSAFAARLDFAAFYEEWTRRSSEAGYFERFDWHGRGSRDSALSTLQTFTLSTSERPGEPGRSYRLRMNLSRENDVWRVASYACEPVAAPEAK